MDNGRQASNDLIPCRPASVLSDAAGTLQGTKTRKEQRSGGGEEKTLTLTLPGLTLTVQSGNRVRRQLPGVGLQRKRGKNVDGRIWIRLGADRY